MQKSPIVTTEKGEVIIFDGGTNDLDGMESDGTDTLW